MKGKRLWGLAKSLARPVLDRVGIEVRRKRPPAPYEPPPLHDDPGEALYLVTQHARPAAFRCPVAAIVDLEGFGFGRDGWHCFVAAARALEREGEAAADALLERYYALHRPRSAAEAYVGFDDAPAALRALPPHLFFLVPWEAKPAEEIHRDVRRWVEQGNRQHGREDLTLAGDGFTRFGPVSPDKRKLELRRLAAVAAALRRTGYDRRHGDCGFTMIRRGRECRWFPNGSGYHRTAVMAAQGADWVPAQFGWRVLVEAADVGYWPQVRSGLWSRREALAYVDYLFEYGSADWARRHGAALGLAAPSAAGRQQEPEARRLSGEATRPATGKGAERCR